jgi:lysophospholipase L1-like esterase
MRLQIYPILSYVLNLGLFFAALTLVSCNKDKGFYAETAPVPPALSDSSQTFYTYLALGDSYTIGQSVPTEDRFPHQTVVRLKQLGFTVSVPEYIATTGWATGNLLNAIASANMKKDFSLVSLLIGVNNQYQGRDTGEYRKQFTQCIEQALLHAGNKKDRVFVLSIPDYGATPFGGMLDRQKITREIDAFNNINVFVSAQYEVSYINITPGSRDALNDLELVANDGLHPSGKEYRKWAELLATRMATQLR